MSIVYVCRVACTACMWNLFTHLNSSLPLSLSVSVSISISVRWQRPSIGLPQTVMMKVLMKISVLWDSMLCDLVEVYQFFFFFRNLPPLSFRATFITFSRQCDWGSVIVWNVSTSASLHDLTSQNTIIYVASTERTSNLTWWFHDKKDGHVEGGCIKQITLVAKHQWIFVFIYLSGHPWITCWP
jgi:hypothetical protein